MPKYNFFPPLDFLAYLKSIHVAYTPGRARTEVCRQLIKHFEDPQTVKRFPKLKASYQILGSVPVSSNRGELPTIPHADSGDISFCTINCAQGHRKDLQRCLWVRITCA
eukprot:GHVT01034910.1.p1 GENE.GHVT01034910.1~~GHVT01034910.1.p1  ORF type:complete len:109 (-),score=1.64 GHVT01034910.1:2262-2588(-)